ncbi:YhcG family protein [Flavobacterium sp. FlaQc-48]|uniref:PDDEXK nuclease domain-containing protein n=1 Tax=Flavobacterium sp. FlaQc-48 TaxID=3374181 RepID=UPI003757D551
MEINDQIIAIQYESFLVEVTNLVQNHRIKAVQSVQTISNTLYWSIGELIIKKQEEFGWGKSIVELLSNDLSKTIGEGISWSPRNLWFMRQLVNEYSNLNQVDSDLRNIKNLVTNVPWQHNILIIQKVKDPKARIFYLESTIKNKYSRSVLLHQIKADSYNKYLQNPSQNNFQKVLAEQFLEQAQESIKSTYSLDFLDINKPISERDLENSMVEKVKRLMLELGYGFCFIGNQYRLSLGNKDYYIDLLFYHRILKCLVAVELKVVEFEPEFIGKLDFYLQLIDDQLKQDDDKPSIGILLVPEKDHLEVEYALRSVNKPIGVSEYILSKKLPKELEGKLPTTEQFKNILNE